MPPEATITAMKPGVAASKIRREEGPPARTTDASENRTPAAFTAIGFRRTGGASTGLGRDLYS